MPQHYFVTKQLNTKIQYFLSQTSKFLLKLYAPRADKIAEISDFSISLTLEITITRHTRGNLCRWQIYNQSFMDYWFSGVVTQKISTHDNSSQIHQFRSCAVFNQLETKSSLTVSPCRTFHPESLYCTIFNSTFQVHNFLGNWSPPSSIPRPPPLTHFFLIVSTALRREEDIWVMYVPTQVFPPAATR